MRISISTLALLSVLALGLTGCSKSLKTLAKGEGELAADAKAVIAALKGSGIEPKAVTVSERSDPACDVTSSCAEVGVLGERIVGLFVNKAKAVDLAALQGAERLRWVRVGKSLRGKVAIKGGPKALESLELNDNDELKELSVEGMSALRALALKRSSVERLSLSGLPKLTRIESPGGIKSITIKQVGMRDLHLMESSLEQLTLSDLPSVKRVTASGRLRQVALSKLPQVTRVNLANNKLEQLKLDSLPALRRLDLARNQLKQVTLSNLPALRRVELQQNKLTKLPTISGSPQLRTLRLGKNQLTTLAGVEALPVKTLYVEHNGLTSLDPAAAAAPAGKEAEQKAAKSAKSAAKKSAAKKSAPPKGAVATARLETLIANHNKVSSLAGLAAYPQLTYLAVDHNKLTTLEGVERAPKLKTLRATHNKLKTVKGGEKLPKLRLLYVSYNQLETLQPLPIAQLHTLYADHNKLSKPKEIFGATSKTRPKIKRYDLRHNALKGVAAGLLVYGIARAGMRYGRRRRGGRYRAGDYRRRGGYRYRGGGRRIRSRGSRYSGGGGYRSGK